MRLLPSGRCGRSCRRAGSSLSSALIQKSACGRLSHRTRPGNECCRRCHCRDRQERGLPRHRSPEPELEPPAQVEVSHGFSGIGKGFSGSGQPIANSIVVVLPMITAPAVRSRATTGASTLCPQSGSIIKLCAVVGPSSVVMMSLTAIGIPCRGPRSLPSLNSRSREAAASMAVSSKRARYVPRIGSSRSARLEQVRRQLLAGDQTGVNSARRRP